MSLALRATLQTCVIAPVLCPAWGCRSSRALGVYAIRAKSMPSFARRGVRNGRAFHRARGARMCLDAGSPHAVFATAHGRWSSPTPKIVELNRASEADLRLRSARGWILRLAACPRGCHWRRRAPVRASCRPDMHLDRPPVVAGVCPRPFSKDRRSSLRPGSGIVAAIRIPLRVSKTIATRPSPERDGITIIILGGKSRTNAERFAERCEQNGG